jgi:hypothetical protein
LNKPSGQAFDQPFLGFQGVSRDWIGLDPVTIVEHALFAVDHAPGAFRRALFSLGRVFQLMRVGHCNSLSVRVQHQAKNMRKFEISIMH